MIDETRAREIVSRLRHGVDTTGASAMIEDLLAAIAILHRENAKLLARLDIQQDNEGGMHDEIDRLQTAVDCAQFDMEKAQADNAELRAAIQTAYGYLWHVNNEPGTPHQHSPESMSYAARKVLRHLMTAKERGTGISRARALLTNWRN